MRRGLHGVLRVVFPPVILKNRCKIVVRKEVWHDLNIHSNHLQYSFKQMPLEKQIWNIPYIMVFFLNLVIRVIQILQSSDAQRFIQAARTQGDAFEGSNGPTEAVPIFPQTTGLNRTL